MPLTALPTSASAPNTPAARAALGSADGLWEWRVDDDSIWLSDPLVELIEPAMGMGGFTLHGLLACVHPDDADLIRDSLHRCVDEGRRLDADFRLSVDEHGCRWFHASAAPLRDETGRIAFVSGLLRDVTAERDSAASLRVKEQQFMQRERMDAIDCLAGGIAHEFNNVLQAVRGYVAFAMDELDDHTQPKRDLEQALTATERATDLTRSLLDFARAAEPTSNRMLIEDEIEGLEALLRPVIGKHIDLKTRVTDDPLICTADAHGLRQSLLNLCINARDAMPEGGELAVSAERYVVDEVTERLMPRLPQGCYCRLRVSDSGVGIADNAAEQVFAPFYTTKEAGRGTGLGLATVHGFAKRSGGAVSVYSEEGRGAAFSLYLPLEEPLGMDHSPDHPELRADGAPLVLLIEDDPQVGEVGRRTLESAGYEVLVAEDGEAGLEAYAENLDRVRLVVIDVVLPKLSGRRVFEEIRRLQSDVPVIFTTGFDPMSAAGVSDGMLADQTLAKPYDRRQLLAAAKSLLAGQREPQALPL